MGFTRLPGYEPIWSPSLENIRVASGRWQTRPGMQCACPTVIPGIGPTRFLATLYTDTAQRIRLAARGDGTNAILYQALDIGIATVFTAASGGTGLGSAAEPYFQGIVQNNRFYFTDRAGVLRVFQYAPASGNQVRSVALPAAPAVAPLISPRTYRILEYFAGAAPFGWTQSDANFQIQDASATFPAPGGGKTVRLHILAGSAVGATITKNVTAEDLSSHTIAFWARLDRGKTSVQFQFGLNGAQEFSYNIVNAGGSEWYPAFIKVGDLPNINFKRFQCIDTFDGDGPYLSQMYLPGRLEGEYRWFYTHYDPVLGRESAPSPISNGGQPSDFSAIGIDGQTSTGRAFQKAAGITVTSDSGVDTTTTRIRIYRNGGVPELTVDSRGLNIWLRVAEIYDQATDLNGAVVASATSFVVDSPTNLFPGDALVLDKGTVGTEEIVVIKTLVGSTVNTRDPLLNNHADEASVQVCFVDNKANELIDVTASIDVERNDPPAAAKFIARSPEGRFWLFNYQGFPTGVAVSNRATPLRPLDYEVFPDSVDPMTRRDLIQGWRFQLGGDQNDEEIVWGGFFRDQATIITRRNIYVITAHSQLDWGPLAVRKMRSVGCIAKDSVKEVNGVLYWVAEGPRVMRWSGEGDPENISHLRVNVRLANADTITWNEWFGIAHAKTDGNYYSLFWSPLGHPLDLIATAVSTSEIDLTWTVTSTGEDGFRLERSLDQATWTVIAILGPTVGGYNDTGLASGTTYFYRVRAFKS